jgi:hypothetical protein
MLLIISGSSTDLSTKLTLHAVLEAHVDSLEAELTPHLPGAYTCSMNSDPDLLAILLNCCQSGVTLSHLLGLSPSVSGPYIRCLC